jgi:hypothetical protein
VQRCHKILHTTINTSFYLFEVLYSHRIYNIRNGYRG